MSKVSAKVNSGLIRVSLLVAIADNGVIGRAGGLPWRLKDDMARLKAMTMGKPIIIGRKTWESFPKRPLPGRPNLIVTRDASYDAPGGEVFTSIEAALERGEALARERGVDEIMILGGAEIYAAAFDRADRLYITEVHATAEGDVSFPGFDPEKWHEISRERHRAEAGDTSDYSFVTLERAD